MALNTGNPETVISIDCQDPAEETPPFKISDQVLANSLQKKDCNSLDIQGIMDALETNAETGIRGDGGDLHRRQRAFGLNEEQLPLNTVVDAAAFFWLVWNNLKDPTIILLLCCALLSAVIEIKRNGVVEGLTDGAMIFSAISFVVFFGLVCRYIKSVIRRRVMMKKTKLNAGVCVIRCGKKLTISDSEVVVGDIVFLEAGNHIPADGFLIEGDSLFKLHEAGFGFKQNPPRLFTGAKVKAGDGKMLVVSVGNNTERSRLMRSASSKDDNDESPLQIRIEKTNSLVERILLSLTLSLLVFQLFKCFLSNSDKCYDGENGLKNTVEELMLESAKLMKQQQPQKVMGIKGSGRIAFLSVLIFALGDGLPLGILVIFVYTKKKIKSTYGATVQNPSVCATIGSITTFCSGDLALNPSEMEMADLWIGFDLIKDVSVELLAPRVVQLLQDGISACDIHESNAISYWAHHVLGEPNKENEESNVVHIHCSGDQLEEFLSICSHYLNSDGTMETLDEFKKDLFNKKFHQQIASINGLQVLAFAFSKHANQDDDAEEGSGANDEGGGGAGAGSNDADEDNDGGGAGGNDGDDDEDGGGGGSNDGDDDEDGGGGGSNDRDDDEEGDGGGGGRCNDGDEDGGGGGGGGNDSNDYEDHGGGGCGGNDGDDDEDGGGSGGGGSGSGNDGDDYEDHGSGGGGGCGGNDRDDEDQALRRNCSKDGFIFLALVSLKNPFPPEMRRTIQDFRDSGVSIKLAVETDIATARIIAAYSGILGPEEETTEGAVIEALEFLERDEEERMKTIQHIQVLANASPVDKLKFVRCLRKEKNKVVAMSSSCIRDSPILKEADIGIFVGGDDFPAESDIIVPNKINNSVDFFFNLVRLGRCVNASVERFMQLQICLNITAFTVNFISAMVKNEGDLIFPFQVLWINLAMDVLGALALAIRVVDCGTCVNRMCTADYDYGNPIITMTTWRHVLVQSSFQVAILMAVEMKLGRVVFEEVDESVLKNMINGCYAFFQLFSLIKAMMISEKNNKSIIICLGIVGCLGFLEVGLLEITAVISSRRRRPGKLNWKAWCFCIGIGALSLPMYSLCTKLC